MPALSGVEFELGRLSRNGGRPQGKKVFPKKASDFVRYLEMRAEEPCGPTVITAANAALKFYEEAAGLEKVDRMSDDPWLQKQVRGLKAELQSGSPVSKQAPRPPVGVLVAMEDAVFDEAAPVTLRCYAFWKLLCAWGTLRFGDHRGFKSEELVLRPSGSLVMMLHRTKTTGPDKKVQLRALVVDKEVCFEKKGWLEVGVQLWQQAAPWPRDFLLPVPSEDLQEWIQLEAKYADAAVLSAQLEIHLQHKLVDRLFAQGVSGRFLKEHSCRCWVPSAAACFKVPETWLDMLGAWKAKASAVYIRTAKRRITLIQQSVSEILRRPQGSDFFDDEDAVGNLCMWMLDETRLEAEEVENQRAR